jgi:hypothetical protein
MEEEPVGILWLDLVDVVFRDSPRQANTARLSSPAQVLFNTCMFVGEITNGGFSQFFSNSSGSRAHETLAGLREIRAGLCVGLLEKALAVFPDGIAPVDHRKRLELLCEFEERGSQLLEVLSDAFYKRVDALDSVPEEDVTSLQLEYMRAHSLESVDV